MGALGERQPFAFLLEYLNVFDEDLFSPLNEQAFDLLAFPSGKIAIPQGYDNVISEWSAAFPSEKDAIRKYFAMVERVCGYFPTYNYNDAPEQFFPPEALDLSLKASLNPSRHTEVYSPPFTLLQFAWSVSGGRGLWFSCHRDRLFDPRAIWAQGRR